MTRSRAPLFCGIVFTSIRDGTAVFAWGLSSVKLNGAKASGLGRTRCSVRHLRHRFGCPFTGKTEDLASMFASEVGRSTKPYQQFTVNDIFTASPTAIHSATFALRCRRTFNDWSSVKLPIDFRQAGVKGIAGKTPPSLYVNVSGGFLALPGWNYDKRDCDIHIANVPLSRRLKAHAVLSARGESGALFQGASRLSDRRGPGSPSRRL